MSKQSHFDAQEATRAFVRDRSIPHHMFYGPTSERYWTEPVRIVALNMEPWGYEGCGHVDAKHEIAKWLSDGEHGRSKTVGYTMALMSVALSRLESEAPVSREMFWAAFKDKKKLKDTLSRTAYYNIRPQSNARKIQDSMAITSIGESEIGQLIWSEVQALDPHVVFVSGRAGLAALNRLIRPAGSIAFRGAMDHEAGFVIQSIAHPSRPNYSQWCIAVEEVNLRLTEKSRLTCHQVLSGF